MFESVLYFWTSRLSLTAGSGVNSWLLNFRNMYRLWSLSQNVMLSEYSDSGWGTNEGSMPERNCSTSQVGGKTANGMPSINGKKVKQYDNGNMSTRTKSKPASIIWRLAVSSASRQLHSSRAVRESSIYSSITFPLNIALAIMISLSLDIKDGAPGPRLYLEVKHLAEVMQTVDLNWEHESYPCNKHYDNWKQKPIPGLARPWVNPLVLTNLIVWENWHYTGPRTPLNGLMVLV